MPSLTITRVHTSEVAKDMLGHPDCIASPPSYPNHLLHPVTANNMADRFVSAGTSEEAPERGSEWLAAQQELDAKALQRKQAEAKHGTGMQDDGRTLYEVLQANKGSTQLQIHSGAVQH